jgi:hypothetical protein
MDELDGSLQLVILGWLQRNELTPNFFKVEAIGEYPVPSSGADHSLDDDREVHEIGSITYEA